MLAPEGEGNRVEQASRLSCSNPVNCFLLWINRYLSQLGTSTGWKRVRCLCEGGSSPAASVGKGRSMWDCREGGLACGDL